MLSGELIAAVVIVIVSSTAFVAAGTITGWDLSSRTNALAMRAIGVLTLTALAAVAAWSRRGQPLAAGLILAGSIVASFGYVRAHVALTRRVREMLRDANSDEEHGRR